MHHGKTPQLVNVAISYVNKFYMCSYLGLNMANEHAYVMAIEKLLHIDVLQSLLNSDLTTTSTSLACVADDRLRVKVGAVIEPNKHILESTLERQLWFCSHIHTSETNFKTNEQLPSTMIPFDQTTFAERALMSNVAVRHSLNPSKRHRSPCPIQWENLHDLK
jgi:hypothetical protein